VPGVLKPDGRNISGFPIEIKRFPEIIWIDNGSEIANSMAGPLYVAMDFSDKLEKLIQLRDTNQSQLARKTGINQSAISEMTKGKRGVSLKQAFALAQALDVSLDYLGNDDLDDEPLPSSLSDDERMVLRIFHSSGLKAEEAVERLLIRKLGMYPR